MVGNRTESVKISANGIGSIPRRSATGRHRRSVAGPPGETDSDALPQSRPNRNFLFVLGAFTGALLLIVLLASAALVLLDTGRAYILGESLYTKGQKEAVIALQRFARSGDPDEFEKFRDSIRVPLGARAARVELEQASFDPDVVRRKMLQAGHHPGDTDGMIRMFRWFGDTPWFRRPRDFWRDADAAVVRIAELGEALHAVVRAEPVDPVRRDRLLSRLATLNREAARAQSGFSNAVRESARLVRNLALMILVSVSFLLWLACGTVALRLHRRNLAAERALAAGEQRLRTLMNSTSDAIVSVFRDGRIALSNLAAERLFGRDRPELADCRLGDLLAPESRPVLERAMEVMLEGDATETTGVRKLRGMRRDGTTFPLEMVCDAEEGALSARLVLSLRDVTEREEVEEKLAQAQKMEAVGQLTAGVAHNFNNLLTVVIGSLEMLDAEPDAPEKERRALLESALDAAQRSAELTAHLLAFSRRQPLQPGPVDVNALVAGMRVLLDRSVPERIEISFRPGPGAGHARVDPVQLESALLNLVINAVHATPDAGRIRIETERRSLTDEEAWRLELSPGTYVLLRVRDSGEGIGPEDLSRVFEPFFTTKEVGLGTGLGLSMVHGFVRQSGGHVRIDSAPGEGTRIELLLPVVEPPPA
mgnify:CR=1 FL=1